MYIRTAAVLLGLIAGHNPHSEALPHSFAGADESPSDVIRWDKAVRVAELIEEGKVYQPSE